MVCARRWRGGARQLMLQLGLLFRAERCSLRAKKGGGKIFGRELYRICIGTKLSENLKEGGVYHWTALVDVRQ